jgi:major vault protein
VSKNKRERENMSDDRERLTRERELVLAPNEYAYVLDTTKGHINCYVGPNKTSLAQTDSPVVFNQKNKRFQPANLDVAIQLFATAPANWYMILKNPAKDNVGPKLGTSNNSPGLQIGKKINVHGPASAPLWPGQMTKVIQGHKLQSNQYLVVQVYDAIEANLNAEAVYGGTLVDTHADFIAGQKVVIKGTDVSFYMPPTGAEVCPDKTGNYVRDAVTLQRLEYAILVSEDGEKNYQRGEAVVFPRPDQTFLTRHNKRRFKAIELSEISGLYIKVIAPYVDEDIEYKEGEELFITGKDEIYFPRKEHAIIRYGDQEVHFAIAIPRGEGRYVLNRLTGEVTTVNGPKMFLPDPRKEVITRRVLSDRECTLLYPSNTEALVHNKRLRGALESSDISNVAQVMAESAGYEGTAKGALRFAAESMEDAIGEWGGDDFARKNVQTKPRTITLDNKYDGVVATDVWTGYAIQIVDKDGSRRVVEGPRNGVMLGYGETIDALNLSTGKPKTTDRLLSTAFLRTTNNYVSDVIGVISSDLVMAQIQVKYLIDFVGDDKAKWFSVDNYVKLLCDHARSKIKGITRKTSIRQLQKDLADIIRDTILGLKPEDGSRTGLMFNENNMLLRDVDVLHFQITTKGVGELLSKSQMDVVHGNIQVAQKESELENTRKFEEIERELHKERHKTEELDWQLRSESERREKELEALAFQLKEALSKQQQQARLEAVEAQAFVQEKQLEIDQKDHALVLRKKSDFQDLNVAYLQEKVNGAVKQAGAFTPHIVEAVHRLGDVQLLSSLAENFGELAALEGKGLLATVTKFLDFKHTGAVIPMLKDPKGDDRFKETDPDNE